MTPWLGKVHSFYGWLTCLVSFKKGHFAPPTCILQHRHSFLSCLDHQAHRCLDSPQRNPPHTSHHGADDQRLQRPVPALSIADGRV